MIFSVVSYVFVFAALCLNILDIIFSIKSNQIKSKLVLLTCDQKLSVGLSQFSHTHAKPKRDNGKKLKQKTVEQCRIREGRCPMDSRHTCSQDGWLYQLVKSSVSCEVAATCIFIDLRLLWIASAPSAPYHSQQLVHQSDVVEQEDELYNDGAALVW